jgi:hypothetical protein
MLGESRCAPTNGTRPYIFDTRDWIGLVAAIASGPIFVQIGHALGVVFGAAALLYFLWCAIVVPVPVLIASRLKFVVWQLGIASLIFAAINDDLQSGSFRMREMRGFVFVSWAMGALLSSPVPVYFFLQPLSTRWRLVFGVAIAAVGLALWFGISKITG